MMFEAGEDDEDEENSEIDGFDEVP